MLAAMWWTDRKFSVRHLAAMRRIPFFQFLCAVVVGCFFISPAMTDLGIQPLNPADKQDQRNR